MFQRKQTKASEQYVNCPKSGKCPHARIYRRLCKISLPKALLSLRKPSLDLLPLPASSWPSSLLNTKDLKGLVFISVTVCSPSVHSLDSVPRYQQYCSVVFSHPLQTSHSFSPLEQPLTLLVVLSTLCFCLL